MFSSKKQYKQITNVYADVFGVNLNKSRHKLAQRCGFKCAQAHEASIPTSAKPSLHHKGGYIDQLQDVNLDCYSEFSLIANHSGFGELTRYKIETTLGIELALSGFTYSEPKKAAFKVVVTNKGGHTHVSGDIWLQNLCITPASRASYRQDSSPTEHFLISIMQRLEPTFIIDDAEYLISNPELTLDLIEYGSIWQYNYFCANPSLVTKLGFETAIIKRYMREIMLAHAEHLIFSFCLDMDDFSFLSAGGAQSTLNCPKLFFLQVDTPPVEFAKGRFVFDLFDSNDFDYIDVVVNDFLGLAGSTYREGVLSSYDRAKIFDRDYEWTEVDLCVLKHGQWAMEFLSQAIAEHGYIGDYEGNVGYFLEALSENPWNLKNHFIQQALFTSIPSGMYAHDSFMHRNGVSLSFVPDMPLEYSLTEWCKIPLVGFLAFDVAQLTWFTSNSEIELRRAHLQYLFSNVGELALKQEINFYDYIIDEDGYANQKTIAGLLRFATNLTNDK